MIRREYTFSFYLSAHALSIPSDVYHLRRLKIFTVLQISVFLFICSCLVVQIMSAESILAICLMRGRRWTILLVAIALCLLLIDVSGRAPTKIASLRRAEGILAKLLTATMLFGVLYLGLVKSQLLLC